MVSIFITTILSLVVLGTVAMQEIEFDATPESLALIVGILLSLLFSYVPGFATWFNRLGQNLDGTDDKGTLKRLVMLGLLLVTSLAIFGLSCGGIIGGVSCDKAGITHLVWIFIWALIGNQTTHTVSPIIGEKNIEKPDVDPNYTYMGKTQWTAEQEDEQK